MSDHPEQARKTEDVAEQKGSGSNNIVPVPNGEAQQTADAPEEKGTGSNDLVPVPNEEAQQTANAPEQKGTGNNDLVPVPDEEAQQTADAPDQKGTGNNDLVPVPNEEAQQNANAPDQKGTGNNDVVPVPGGEEEIHKIEDVLDIVLEEISGCYHVRNICLIVLVVLAYSVQKTEYIFVTGEVKYRCLVPECEKSSGAPFKTGPWAEWARPKSCSRAAPRHSASHCTAADFDSKDQPCTAWVYESDYTIVTEFNLACQEWKRSLVGTVYNAGMLTALCFIGIVSDVFGRRLTFIVSAVLPAVFGLARTLVHSYYLFIGLQFLGSLTGSSVFTTAYILAVEQNASKYCVSVGILMSVSYTMGQLLLALIAWSIPHWRPMTILLYAPCILFLSYFLYIHESVRWLISHDRFHEAYEQLKRIAKINGRALPDVAKELLKSPPRGETSSAMSHVRHSKKLILLFLNCTVWWILISLVYYGMSITSVSLGGNKYINFSLMSLVELPGLALSAVCLNRFGCKRFLVAVLIICFWALFIMVFLSEGPFTVILGLIGKLFITAAYAGIYVYTVTLWPTPVRHRALGACVMVSRLGLLVAPFTPLMMSYWKHLPYVFFAISALLASLMLCLIPNVPTELTETVESTLSLHESQHRQSLEHASRKSRTKTPEHSNMNVKDYLHFPTSTTRSTSAHNFHTKVVDK